MLLCSKIAKSDCSLFDPMQHRCKSGQEKSKNMSRRKKRVNFFREGKKGEKQPSFTWVVTEQKIPI